MKKLKLCTIALLLIVGPVLIESCCWDCDSKCYVRKHKPRKFNIEDIELKVGVRYSYPYKLAQHSNRPGSIEFLFEFKSAGLSYSEPQVPFFRPTMAAFAQTKCNPDRVESVEALDAYTIVSNNTLITDKGTFEAGEDLSSLFYLNDGGNGIPFHGPSFNLYPSFAVKERGEHAFTVSLTLNDGRHFDLETASFELIP